MKTLKFFLFATFVLIAFTLSASQKRKVLIIGIDGVRSDALQQANTPNIDALITEGLYTWDAWHLGITVSGPSWSTIMTGVWWNKHGVTNNNYTGSKFNQYPYFTTRAKELLPNLRCVEVIEWPPLIDDVYNDSWDLQLRTPDHDGAATEQVAVQEIQQDADVDIMFVYFDQVDGAGHSSGFDPNNPSYMQAIEDADIHVGAIVNAVKNRPTYNDENWLILLTTDHGGIGTGHGGVSYEERHIWWIANGNSVAHRQITAQQDPGTYNYTLDIAGVKVATGVFDPTGVDENLVKLSPVQADIAVTALHHIIYETGVNPEDRTDWDLDGKSWLSTIIDTSVNTGINHVEDIGISVFPNPTTGLITFWFPNPNHNNVNYLITDMSGKEILRKENVPAVNKLNVDFGRQPKGNYLISLELGGQKVIRQISLQ